MKHTLQRVFVLTVILAMAVTQLPGIALSFAGLACKAEERIPKPFSLSESAIGDEQEQGEWRYALRDDDGYAVITGWSGSGSAIIPDRLGGTEVVGIAANALASCSGTVSVPSAVLWMDTQAFGDAHPTISALNGSLAQWFAGEYGYAYTTPRDYELVPGVIDFTDAPSGHVKRAGDEYVRFSRLEGIRLSIGSIFWMEDAHGETHYYRVDDIQEEAQGIVARVSVPELSEAVVDAHVTGTHVFTMEDFTPAEGTSILSGSAKQKALVPIDPSAETITISKTLGSAEKGSASFSLEVTLSLESKVNYTVDVIDGKVTYSSIEKVQSGTVAVKSSGGLSGPKDLLENTDFGDPNGLFTTGKYYKYYKEEYDALREEINMGSLAFVGGWVSVYIDLKAGANITGKLNVEYKFSSTTLEVFDPDTETWTVTKDNGNARENKQSLTISGSVEGKIYVSLKATVKVVHFIRVAELKIEPGIKASVEQKATFLDGDLTQLDIPCMVIQFKPYLSVSMTVGAWVGDSDISALDKPRPDPSVPKNDDGWDFKIKLDHGIKLPLYSHEFDFYAQLNRDVPKVHIALPISIPAGMPNVGFHSDSDCPYNRLCTVSFDTKTSEQVDKVYVEKFETIPASKEPHPTMGGHLLGWADNINAAQPNFVFGEDGNRVPASMMLYAVWANTETVEFDSMGGSEIQNQYVPAGGYADPPDEPVKENARFIYWYTLDDLGRSTIWDFNDNTVPAGGVKLYARWNNEDEYNGGTQEIMYIGDPDSVDVVEDYGYGDGSTSFFNYSVVRDPNGKCIGLTINSVKNDPVDLLVPEKLFVNVDMEGLNIPEAVVATWVEIVNINRSAFQNCKTLRSIQFETGVGLDTQSLFSGCTALEYADLSNCSFQTIQSSCFSGCTSLKLAVLPKGIWKIDNFAFSGCAGIKKAILPEGLADIGGGVFENCTGLEEISIPSTATMGGYIFSGDVNIRRIELGSLKTSSSGTIIFGGFDGSVAPNSLEEIVIRGTVKSITGWTFHGNQTSFLRNGKGSARLVIEEGVESIGNYAFYCCSSIGEVVLPESLTNIWNYAFYGCKLEKLQMGDSIQVVGNYAFYVCSELTDIHFSSQLTSIGESAFERCVELKKAILPEGLTSIGAYAFRGCTGLEEISIPSTAAMGNYIFQDDVNIRRIELGSLPSSYPYDVFRGGYNGQRYTHYILNNLEEIVIRGTVKAIPADVFYSDYNSFLRNGKGSARLVIEEGVESIGSRAFYNCTSLGEVILPESLTSIGSQAFYGCNKLTMLKLGAPSAQIASNAFTGCSALTQYTQGTALPSFALTLEANGGTFENGEGTFSRSLEWNEVLGELPAPAWEGRLFSGWFMDAACEKRFTGLTGMPAHDLTLYAGWDVDVYTLTLRLNGGTLEGGSVRRVPAGTDLSADIAPTRSGYMFTGWYTNEERTRSFNGIMPGNDLTLYADWSNVKLNADYLIENGEATLINYSMVEGESGKLWLPETVDGVPLRHIAANAFYGEPITELTLPASLTDLDAEALSGMPSLRAIHVRGGSAAYSSVDGILFSADGSTLIRFPAARGYRYVMPFTVRHIADRAFEDAALNSIVFSEGLISIGDCGFQNAAISKILLPDSLETIGGYAFYGCANVSVVVGGSQLSMIGDAAFEGGAALLPIYGPESDCALKRYAENYHRQYNPYRLILNNNGATATHVVQAGSRLTLPTNMDVGENYRFTGWYADSACTAAWPEDGVMPASELVLYAGRQQIWNYEVVAGEDGSKTVMLLRFLLDDTTVTVPETLEGYPVTAIVDGCFGENVTAAAIPACVESIGEQAFVTTDGLTITCSANTAASEYALAHGASTELPTHQVSFDTAGGLPISGMTLMEGESLALPTPVRSGYAFDGWLVNGETVGETLTMGNDDVTLMAQWTVVDEAAATLSFTWTVEGDHIIITGPADGATEVSIPDALNGLPVTGISEGAFAGATELTTVILPDSITTIPAMAFSNCWSLSSVRLGNRVAQIEAQAFEMCASLEALALPESLERIGSEALAGTSVTQLCFGADFVLLDRNALEDCSALERIDVAAANPYYRSVDGVLYDITEDALVKYPPSREATAYSVEAGTYSIGYYAFADAHNLRAVELPDSVWTIEEGAFAGCRNLRQIPNITQAMIKTMPEHCFTGCSSLREVTIPDNITVIGKEAFSACANMTKVTIPANVHTIGGNAFSGTRATIYTSAGSAAQAWAEQNNVPYVIEGTVLPERVTINEDELQLKRGETLQLTAQIEPENVDVDDLAWYSVDPSIATVGKNGLVRALSGGETLIVAQTRNGLIAGCIVEVDSTIEPIQIIPTKLSVEVFEGDQTTVDIRFEPVSTEDRTLTYSSSDETIATVDANGTVTAVSEGSAMIRATANNGAFGEYEVNVLRRVYAISIAPHEHGKVTLTISGEDADAAHESDTVCVTAVPDDHYLLEALTYTPEEGEPVAITQKDGAYCFEMPGATVTVNASFVTWYTVRFDRNAADAAGEMADQTLYVGRPQTLTPNAYSRAGYSFAGWNTLADPTEEEPGIARDDGAEVLNLTELPNGNVTLYAQWHEIPRPVPKFAGYRLRLSGILGLRYFMRMPDGFDDASAQMTFTIEGATQTVTQYVEETLSGITYRVYECGVHAYQMAENITAVFSYGDGQSVTDSYSVRQYLNAITEGDYTGAAKTLVEATCRYGHYIQPYLQDINGSSHEPLNYEGTLDIDAAKAGANSHPYALKYMDSDAVEKAQFFLTVNAGTDLNVTIQLKEGVTGTVTASANGKRSALVPDGGIYKATVRNIAADNLDVQYPFSFELDGVEIFSIDASVLSYARMVLNGESNDNETNAVAALYHYYAAAEAYNDSQNQ